MREGGPGTLVTEPLPERSLVNGLRSALGTSGGFFSPAPGRDLEASDRSPQPFGASSPWSPVPGKEAL